MVVVVGVGDTALPVAQSVAVASLTELVAGTIVGIASGTGLKATREDVAPVEALSTKIASGAVRRAASVDVAPFGAGLTLIVRLADLAPLAFTRAAGCNERNMVETLNRRKGGEGVWSSGFGTVVLPHCRDCTTLRIRQSRIQSRIQSRRLTRGIPPQRERARLCI